MTSVANKLADLSTMQLARSIAVGECSATEALQTCQARIEATDGRIHAFTDRTWQRARAEAAAVDASRARGERLPALAGVPYAVKNLFDVEGVVTRAGSKVNRSLPPAAHDAVLVSRLKAAGAVLVGALNMDEYAYGFTTENTHDGTCCNPHDLACIAGGSSGGSAAAIAAGQLGLSLGSDTNGSIRVPASLCGVWGLKPTFGRLSRRGAYPFVYSIDHLGPFADSVEALSHAYDAMQGPDALDPGCHVKGVDPTVDELDKGVAGLRIGVLGGYFETQCNAAARDVVEQAAQVLQASDRVQWPDAAIARAAAFIMTASEGASLHLPDLRQRADDFEPLVVDRFIAGALQPAHWYLRAQRFRRVYRDKVQALFEHWDVLLAPATPVTAPAIGTEWIEISGQRLPCRPSMGLLTQPISFAGCPVVAAPLWPQAHAVSDGPASSFSPQASARMPLGVQVIAAPWREDLALRAARLLERSGVAQMKKVAL